MSYTSIFIALSLCVLATFAIFIVAIVHAFRRKWKSALITASFSLLLIFASLAAGAALTWKAAHDVHHQYTLINDKLKQSAAAETAKRDAIKALTPTVDWTKIDPEFFDYNGFRDWFRVPLRYPYDMNSIDNLDFGSINKNHANGKSDDPNIQCNQIGPYITHYTYDAHFLLARASDDLPPKTMYYTLFTFYRDTFQTFPTEADLLAAATKAGFTGNPILRSVKDHYDTYWTREFP